MTHTTTRLAFTRLQKSAHPTPEWEQFAQSIDFDFSKIDADEQDLVALCIGELIRLYWPTLPFDLYDAVTALSNALPHLAEKMPKKCLGLLQGLQWHDVFGNLNDDSTCSTWLYTCQKLALLDVSESVLTAAVSLAANAAPQCHINTFLELAIECPHFWVRVSSLVDGFEGLVSFYFESSLQGGPLPLSEATLFADLAESAPAILCGYKMPICAHQDMRIRIQAARAYAHIDPDEPAWQRLSIDREPEVRLEWARAAQSLDLDLDWSPLFCDSNLDVREIALRHGTTFQLVPLLRHSDVEVAASILGALCNSSTLDLIAFEAIVRFLSRDRDHLMDNLAVARPLLDSHAHMALELEGKSLDALMWLNGHILLYYNAVQVLEGAPSSKTRATEKWLSSRVEQWHRIKTLKVSSNSSNFEKLATPLFNVQWLFDTPAACALLEQVSKACPSLLTGHLPRITPATGTSMLRIIMNYAQKLPYKLVNPSTSILADKCQEKETSYEAAEILYCCAPTFFEEMAAELLEVALEVRDFKVLLVLSRVVPVLGYLDPTDPESSEVYARIASLDMLESWLERILGELDELQCRATLIAVLERDSVPVQCFPWIAKYMDARVSHFIATRVRQNYQLLPLLCFYPAKIPPNFSIEDSKVYSAFCRVVFIGCSLQCDMQPVTVFCERFATRQNIGTLLQLSKRLHHFELHEPSPYLYRYLKDSTKVLDQIKRENRWVGAAETVDVPMDCFKRHARGVDSGSKRLKV